MLPFAGVSMVISSKVHTTPAFDARTNSGYHLLVVKDYSRTVQEIHNGISISTEPFIVGGHQWSIEYYPSGDKPSCSDYISLYVRRDDENIEDHVEAKAQFEFSFVDQVEKQKPTYIRSTETYNFSVTDRSWGYEKLIKRDILERSAHLKEDCFTIRCDIMVCNDLNSQQDPDIGQQFKILLQDKLGSDVTFQVGSELLHAHRCVLAARSNVFKAQLFGPMMEGITSSVIQIKDIEPKVFTALLSFIYTDAFPSMDEEEGHDEEEEGQDGEDKGQEKEEAVREVEEEVQEDEGAEPITWLKWLQDLFAAADRYDIQHLKFLCENKLSENIGVSSVASTLALAEQHQCHGLKEACLKFIQVQSLPCLVKIMGTDDWKQITGTYGSVLNELIVKLASNQNNDKKRKR